MIPALMISIFGLVVSIFCTSVGNILYKVYAIRRMPFLLVFALICFIITPFTTRLALRGLSLDIVYMSASVSLIFVVYLSNKLIKEKIGLMQYIGIFILLIGIIIYNL